MANVYEVGKENSTDMVGDAVITLSNGDLKSLKTVAIGDEVACVDDNATVAEVWDDVEIETMIYLQVGSKSVILRKYRPVLTQEGIIVACEIKRGMKVLTLGNEYEAVDRIKEVHYFDRVTDVDVKREGISNIHKNVFYMNGIAVGDYTYENHLEYCF